MPGSFRPRGGFRGGYGKKRTSPEDDDSTSRYSKKVKGDEDNEGPVLVPELQKDEEGNDYVALKSNDLRRVTVSEFKGNTLVSIREYWKNDVDEIKPGKKGISLTLDQFNALVTALPLLESVLIKKGNTTVRPNYDDEKPIPVAIENGQDGDNALAAKSETEDETD